MRSILFLTLVLPVVVSAQINRSAREFASEQVRDYVTKKLFKDYQYKPGSFGDIKEYTIRNNANISWTIEHKFEVTKIHKSAELKDEPKEYKFEFYLDDKMKVVRAESYFIN